MLLNFINLKSGSGAMYLRLYSQINAAVQNGSVKKGERLPSIREAAAQLGVYVAFIIAILLGFTPQEAAAIGIIGGADGPTVIVTSSASGHTACSSMHFEPEYEPDWCMVFYNKPKEDIEIELI